MAGGEKGEGGGVEGETSLTLIINKRIGPYGLWSEMDSVDKSLCIYGSLFSDCQ